MSFKNFIHTDEQGKRKEITNYREWERAGYRDALDYHKGDMKEQIKEKMDKVKFKEGRKKVFVV